MKLLICYLQETPERVLNFVIKNVKISISMTTKRIKEEVNIEVQTPSPEEEEAVKAKIKAVLDAKEADPEKQAQLELIEEEKKEALEKIKIVLDAEENVIEEAAEKLAPDFDYEEAALDIEAEEAAEEIRTLYGIELLWANYEAEHRVIPVPPALVEPSKYPKPAYEAKTRVGKFFCQDIHHKVMFAWVALFLCLVIGSAIEFAIPDKVNVNYMIIRDAHKESVVVETRARTVGELKDELIAMGYDIGVNDAMIPAAEADVHSGMTVEIMESIEKTAMVAGAKRDIFLIPGTVGDNLEFNNIVIDDNDEVHPSLDTQVSAATRIVVNEVHYKTKEKQEKVKAVSKVILDPSLESGVQLNTKGNDGEGVFIYKYKYVNGKKVKTSKTVKKWIKEPHDNALRLGTSATGNSGEYIVIRTFIANCTAYSARPGAHGSIGEPVHRGTCAVDPKFVPYRSEMWIEGYGYAYANDCGSAVKNNVVDLFMPNNSDCIKWGRRNKTAYILRPIK